MSEKPMPNAENTAAMRGMSTACTPASRAAPAGAHRARAAERRQRGVVLDEVRRWPAAMVAKYAASIRTSASSSG